MMSKNLPMDQAINKLMVSRLARAIFAVSISGGLVACANTSSEPVNYSSENSASVIEARDAQIKKLETELANREAELANAKSSSASFSTASYSSDLLPPNAKTGECYARLWVEPEYINETEQVLIREASEDIELIPAKYEWDEETVLVSEASTKLIPVPAVYGTETERLLVKAEENTWRIENSRSAAPASDKLLNTASSHGIDLAAATPGMCFHEHFVPEQYQTVTEEVLASEASTKIETSPAKYEWVEESVLVSEASFRMEEVPAVYETQTEQVVDIPAHTIWKKGTGPIQRIDEATGEIMCLVDVPATYKTISKRVLVSEPTTRRIEIPAKYETVKVKKLVSSAQQNTIDIPASYKTVSRTEKVADASFVWHEIHDKTMSADSRTGAKICLVNEPAQYKTVSRQVVKTAASVKEVEIPAAYDTVKVKRLVAEASEKRTPIPAEYRTVSHKKLVKDGHMQWRSILCETNITRDRITQIQRALKAEGYNPGAIDGVIGNETMKAVNAFQRDNKLPVDKHLNMQTIKSLGIDV